MILSVAVHTPASCLNGAPWKHATNQQSRCLTGKGDCCPASCVRRPSMNQSILSEFWSKPNRLINQTNRSVTQEYHNYAQIRMTLLSPPHVSRETSDYCRQVSGCHFVQRRSILKGLKESYPCLLFHVQPTPQKGSNTYTVSVYGGCQNKSYILLLVY